VEAVQKMWRSCVKPSMLEEDRLLPDHVHFSLKVSQNFSCPGRSIFAVMYRRQFGIMYCIGLQLF